MPLTEEQRTFLEALPAAVFVASDAQCNAIHANRRGCALLGLDADAAPAEVHEADGIGELLAAMRRGLPATGESFTVVAADGVRHRIVANVAPWRDGAGEPQGVIAVVLAARREADGDADAAGGAAPAPAPGATPPAPDGTGRASLEAGLRRALERDELELYFQPQADMASGEVRGVEVLLRWRHPDRGLLLPGEFIAAAEESGLIIALGDWVFHEACRAARRWSDAGLPSPTLAINVSARQFARHPLADICRRALEASGIEAQRMEIEVTEGAVAADPERALRTMKRLRELGLRLALDDFGTGRSNLAALKRLPLQRLKVDRGFTRDVVHDPATAAIAGSIIAMAHGLGMQTTIAGVESEAQRAFLRRLGCDEFQGFCFSRPLPEADLVAFLGSGRPVEEAVAGAAAERQTLLLVDDEPGVINALQRLFRRDGYHVLTAYSGAEALDVMACSPVQVVISDQRMPEMSGTEFLACVKKLYPDTVRIVLSGYTDLAAVTDAINHGAIYQFLTKPWDDALLRDHVRRAFAAWGQAQRRSVAAPHGGEHAGEAGVQ